ncbi:MAG: hypothetical protein QXL54_04570 [Candidatus Bathyarchaeia archaeon]
MLLSEMVRKIRNEENLVYDPDTYSTTTASWLTFVSKSLSLSEDSFIAIFFNLIEQTSAIQFVRVKVTVNSTDYYVYANIRKGNTSGALEEHGVLLYLPAGSITVTFEGKTNNASYPCQIKNIMIGKISFSDMTGLKWQTYSTQLSTGLASRKTCLGATKKGVLLVNCTGVTSNDVTNFQNPGESLTNYVKLLVDGVQYAWTDRRNDPTSGEVSWAVAAIPASLDEAHTITIEKGNSATAVNISVTFSPWLLPKVDVEALSLLVPQGSTVYVTLEPLFLNPTKIVKLGKKRAVTFGDSTDFYSTASGTGILNWNYTFESVSVEQVSLFVSGFGGCISIIGVDVR